MITYFYACLKVVPFLFSACLKCFIVIVTFNEFFRTFYLHIWLLLLLYLGQCMPGTDIELIISNCYRCILYKLDKFFKVYFINFIKYKILYSKNKAQTQNYNAKN